MLLWKTWNHAKPFRSIFLRSSLVWRKTRKTLHLSAKKRAFLSSRHLDDPFHHLILQCHRLNWSGSWVCFGPDSETLLKRSLTASIRRDGEEGLLIFTINVPPGRMYAQEIKADRSMQGHSQWCFCSGLLQKKVRISFGEDANDINVSR